MKTRSLVQAGVIAAVYVLLTLAFAPVSSGLIQCRLSEALCVLPLFSPAAVPGLFIGCLAANLLTGAPLYDVLFGSLATLLAALCTRAVPNRGALRFLAPLPSVLINAVIVGWLLRVVYAVPAPLPLAMLYVGAGQALACYGLGVPLMLALTRLQNRLF